jgi:hypothetical protein
VLGAELLLGCELGEKLVLGCALEPLMGTNSIDTDQCLRSWGSAWRRTTYLERRWDQSWEQH